MEFRVNFVGKKVMEVDASGFELFRNYAYAIDIKSEKIGVSLLEKLGLKNDNVLNNYISLLQENPEITIDIELARRSDLFKNTNSINVIVTYGLLNQFLDYNLEHLQTDQNGRNIFNVRRVINEEKVLEFWEQNNFSLEIFTDEENALLELRKFQVEKNKILQEEKKQREQQEREEEEKAKEERLQEKLKWIAEHGSQHLKDCVELGYRYSYIYKTERAKIEFPDFQIHSENDYRIYERYNPTVESIEEVKSLIALDLNAEVVWAEEQCHNGETYEAIIIKDYLGNTTLIKIL
jgi:hypothetical protein